MTRWSFGIDQKTRSIQADSAWQGMVVTTRKSEVEWIVVDIEHPTLGEQIPTVVGT